MNALACVIAALAALLIGGALGFVAGHGGMRARRIKAEESSGQIAELGRLAGGLAHEIKNPLSTLGLNLQMAEEDLADLERGSENQGDETAQKLGRIRRRFETVSRESQRLREILDDFLRFAGRMHLERAPADVNQLVDELCDFFEPQAQQAGVRVMRRLSADPATAPLDGGLLKQALLNLMVNANQAMSTARQGVDPHGGADELIVTTRRSGRRGRGWILIDVIDTGPGMAPEDAEKVFRPYFTTKGGGTGLGLPTARRIVEEHGGKLTMHTEPGRGTDFTLALPEQTEKSGARDQEDEAGSGEPSGTIG